MKMDEIKRSYPVEKIVAKSSTSVMTLHSAPGKSDGYLTVHSIGSQSWRSAEYLRDVKTLDKVVIKFY